MKTAGFKVVLSRTFSVSWHFLKDTPILVKSLISYFFGCQLVHFLFLWAEKCGKEVSYTYLGQRSAGLNPLIPSLDFP